VSEEPVAFFRVEEKANAGFLLGLFFDHEDGGVMFMLNFG
jgi:hypothetical protein